MCGRFTLTFRKADLLAHQLGVPIESFGDYSPRYNIAPTQDHWIMRMEHEDREVLPARWGLINHWAKDSRAGFRQINARAEIMDQRPAFRDAFRKRRCVVPADGFYEWTGAKGSRQPIWFHREDGGLLLFAGLYESWQPVLDVWEPTFTIVTTQANATIQPIHDRMPVILPEELVDEWLHPAQADPVALSGLLGPAREGLLIGSPVSPRVNSTRWDDPECLDPIL